MRVREHARAGGIAAALAIAAGCSGLSPDARSTDDLTGYAQAGCGPTDGPAVELYLTRAATPMPEPRPWLDSIARIRQVPDSVAQGQDVPVLRVLVWDAVNHLPGRRFRVEDDRSPWGDISVCGAHGCVPLDGGWIRFTSWDTRELMGEYEIRSAGVKTTGGFRAAWVRQTFLCG